MHSVVPASDEFTVVKHKVDARIFQSHDMFPRRALIILENELLARVLSVPPNRLKMFNVFRCHVCQETEILMNEPSEVVAHQKAVKLNSGVTPRTIGLVTLPYDWDMSAP